MTSHRGRHASTAGTSTAEAQDWRSEAACRGADPELWFPVGEPGSKKYEQVAAVAKSICHDECPVIAECLEDVLRTGDSFGIRGGLDPDERAKQFAVPKRKRKPAYPCAVCGVGMGAPKNKGVSQPRYCSDECRTDARREQRAAYDQKRKEVAAWA